MANHHALVIGASGLIGWSVVNQLLQPYPSPSPFRKVTALVNRPLSLEDSFWPVVPVHDRPELKLISGADLLCSDEDFESFLVSNIMDVASVSHVYYFSFRSDADSEKEVQTNVGMMCRVVRAVKILSANFRFFVYPGGTRGYGIYRPDGIFTAPLTEALADQLPDDYVKTVAYPHYRALLAKESKDQQWTWCELVPDVIVGFTPNGSGFSLAGHWAVYLCAYRLVHGRDAKVPYPGVKAGCDSLFTEVSATTLAKLAIHASLHPENFRERIFNVADSATPGSMRQRWPQVASWFGLTGVPPPDTASANDSKPSDFIKEHEEKLINAGVKGVDIWNSGQLDSVGYWLTFDRHLSLDRLKSAGFHEDHKPEEGWWDTFLMFKKAGMIHGARTLFTGVLVPFNITIRPRTPCHFPTKWILITHKLHFLTAGEYVSFDYAGFSFFLILDQQGNINGFHSICRHRAYPIVQQQWGKASVLSCKCHGWSYGLKGNLAKAPRFDTVPSFDKTQHNLLPVHVHVDKVGFVWVNLEAGVPTTPWSSEFGGVDEQKRMTQFGYSSGYAYDHTWTMDLTSNLKTVIENYNECYHCPTSHPLIAGVPDLPKYRVDPVGGTLEHTIVNKSAGKDGEDADEMKKSITYFMPCTSVTVTRNFFYIQRMIPTGAQETRIENEVYRHSRSSDQVFNSTIDFYKQVLEEDKVLCEGMQRNLDAGVFRNGELHPEKERGPLRFQAWVKEEVMSWREREKREGVEIWPASPKVDEEMDTQKLGEEEAFCSELEKASCGKRDALEW